MREIVFLARAKLLPKAEKSVRRKADIREAAVAGILAAAETAFARSGFAGATMAQIATRATVPKANLHYYFRSKLALYQAVLGNILALWLTETDGIHAQAHPAQALGDYIRAKLRLAAARPDASRVFANELLHGAPQLGGYLRTELKSLIDTKAAVFAHWHAQGSMDDLDAHHLFFTIWAATQTYADFQPQVCAVLGKPALDSADWALAADQLVRVLLKGCGVL